MAYTPINWQTGDTITADRLNKMDNGWGIQNTQLFSETVTTVDEDGMYVAQLAYSGTINANTINVTFDGTEYTCPSIGEGEYGAPYNEGNPDFSVYPFNLYVIYSVATLTTQTAGEHTVSVSATVMQTSADFAAAVAVASFPELFIATANVTTWQEVHDAVAAKKLAFVYEKSGDDLYCYPVLSVTSGNGYEVTTVMASGGDVSTRYYQADTANGSIYPN